MSKKQLELDEHTALRLYPTAAPEFKELLEQNFGKEFFNQNITDRINNYNDVLKISGTTQADDEVKIKGFNDAENKMVKAIIKKMRICKVYNQGVLPKRGEQRWYSWYNVSSGFVFHNTNYDDTAANTGSASRLSFKTSAHANDFVKKFKDVDEAIIDMQD